MSVTIDLGNGKMVTVTGGNERVPAVISVNVDGVGFDMVDYGHRKNGYVCESRSPSAPKVAPKHGEAVFIHQHNNNPYRISSGD